MIIYQDRDRSYYNSGDTLRKEVISKRSSKRTTTKRKGSVLSRKNSEFLKKLGFKLKTKSSK